jgi:hypothetical protein
VEETDAYDHLRDLQGRSIPNMYAHVRLVRDDFKFGAAADLQARPETARCFDVKGILIEHIHGYCLTELGVSPLAPSRSEPEKLSAIVQSTMDAVHEMNKRGVLFEFDHIQPRHVIVKVSGTTHTPFIIDLTRASFKDRMQEEWRKKEMSYEDFYGDPCEPYCEIGGDLTGDVHPKEGWNYEVEWWSQVRTADGPGGIGCLMQGRMERMRRPELDIKYVEYEEILKENRTRS